MPAHFSVVSNIDIAWLVVLMNRSLTRQLMMFIKIRKVISTHIILILPLFSCCAIEELEFNTDTLPEAVLNQEYNAIITASVRNNPDDDSFDYKFALSGTLPAGLIFTKDPENRRVIISGTPMEQGAFVITLQAKVSAPNDSDSYSDDPVELIFIDIPAEVGKDAVCGSHYEHEQTYTLNVSII